MAEIPDMLDTFASASLQKLAGRRQVQPERYTPSYMARIMSRSMPEENQQKIKGMRRGQIGGLPSKSGERVILRIWDLDTPIKYGPYEIRYETIVFPGTHFGDEIFRAMDKKVLTFTPTSDLNELLRRAAFQTVVTASAHAFPDVNGRISVGLADTYLRANAGRSLDMNLLSDEKKMVELADEMIRSTYLLLPEKYNPRPVIEELKRKNKFSITLTAPYLGPFKFQVQSQVKPFRPLFAESIITFINGFDSSAPKTDDPLNIYFHIDNIADIYRENLVDTGIGQTQSE